MNNTILWRNPSMTCLGDRLLDTMILATYTKILDADIHFPWIDCPFTIGGGDNPTYSYSDGVNKTWDKVRFEDYKFGNFTQYFNLPKNIKIDEVIENPTYFFDDILGGCVSPLLFYSRYLTQVCTEEEFERVFREIMNEFTPTDKLLELVKGVNKPLLSVHLRRTDKINVKGDGNSFMTFGGLEDLNNRTHEAINIFYNNEKSFYFSSDDKEVLNNYHEEFPNHIEHQNKCLDIEKTYIDLYMLSISEYIILSQFHSNFSVFASYINKAKLIYLYDGCMIETSQFNRSDNFFNYKTLTI